MPQIRAEQIRSLSLKDTQIASDASIMQSKIQAWQDDATGWISKGIIKIVSNTASTPDPNRPGHYYELEPTWDGTQAGSLYYILETDELYVGTSQLPYKNLLVGPDGATTDKSANWESIIVVKQGDETTDFNSGVGRTIQCDSNIAFALDASDVFVYVNGILQEYGAAHDKDFHTEDSRTIKFEYDLTVNDKITLIIMNNNDFVNYPTKAYLGATNINSGSTHVGVNPIGNLSSNNVQDALEELQRDLDMVTGGENLIYSLDDAYEDGGVVYVDQENVDFNLNGKSFRVSDNTGSAPTNSYMLAVVGGDKAVSSETGLSNGTRYYFIVNSVEYNITTSGSTIYSSLLLLLNQTAPSYSWSLKSGNLCCSSRTTGSNELHLSHSSTLPDLFNALSGFTGFGDQNLGSNGTQGSAIFEVFSNDTTSTIKAYKTILPQGSIDLGSATNKWENIYAKSAYFDTNTIYLGTSNIISVQNGKLSVSNDNGSTYGEIAKINVPGTPVALTSIENYDLSMTTSGTGVTTIKSDNQVTIDSPLVKMTADAEVDGSIIPSQNATSNLGNETKRFNSVYTNSICFRPLAETTDYAKITTEANGTSTIVHHQIGRSEADQIVFESNNGSAVSSLMTIDGSGTVTIPGNLVVSGTTNTVTTTNTNVRDQYLTLKYNSIGIDGDSSIVVRRAKNLIEGDRDAKLSWNDTTNRWTATYGANGETTDNLLVTSDLSSMSVGGNAETVTVAANSANASYYPTFVTSASGSLSPKTATTFTFNPNTGALSATSFNGAGTGLTGTASSLSIGGNATTATTATHIASGAIGSLPYQASAGSTSLLVGNATATKKFLTQTGTGSASAAPAWGTIVSADITDATNGNTANMIVKRDTNGSFSAGVITAALTGNVTGNASTATKLATARTLTLSGDATGSTSFDGSDNVSITVTVADNSHNHTSANISDATNVNTGNMIVKRDASGGFSAETISAALIGNVTGNCSGSSGSCTGNASTATQLAVTRTLALSGDVTGSATFDGSANATIAATVTDNSHNHTSANISDATNANTANMIVKRDASGNFAAGTITATNLTLSGDLTINGTTTTIDTTNLLIEDNVIVLNKNQTGTPSSALLSGIEVERGDSANYSFMFRESDNTFVIGESTGLQAVATRQDSPTANAIPFWNDTLKRFDSSSATISGSVITGSLSGNASTASAVAWTGITGGPKTGSSTFAGSSTAKTIAHGLGRTPTFVGISPNANPSGYLGEVWYTADATNINVYNSGSAVTAFTWFAV